MMIQLKNLATNRVWLRIIMGLFVVADVLLGLIRTALKAPSWLIFFEDDFFYYLKIAQNIAHGAGSSFNGVVETNGYHPLWMGVLVLFSYFTSNGHVIFVLVVLVIILSALATFLLSAVFLQQCGASMLLAHVVAAYVAIYAVHVLVSGMEVILAIPLTLLLAVFLVRLDCWKRGFWQSALVGLCISGAILSRLDLMIFVALLFMFALTRPVVWSGITREHSASVVLGLTPIVAYLISNRHFFGVWLPISGMAKQLRFAHTPSLAPWTSVYGHNAKDWVVLLPIQLAVIALPFAWSSLSEIQRILLPALLLFQPVYVMILSCLSDWRLWGWYRYPSRAALCASVAVFCVLPLTRKMMQSYTLVALVFAAVCVQVLVARWTTSSMHPIYDAAEEIRSFALTHPGTYAMGDRSGMVAYLLPDPLIQTEGLVMDKPFLDVIKRQEPLLQALSAYNVRYYIGTAVGPYSGCFHAVEPYQAGSTSAHMKSDLCQAPVATFPHPNDSSSTLIFDLQNNR